MASFQAFPPTGRTLPKDWQAQAARNAAEAQAIFEATVGQAWRQPLTSQNSSMAQGARLSNHQPPAPPKRSDARSDTRMDSRMEFVWENDEMQLWRNANGTTVQIMKRKK